MNMATQIQSKLSFFFLCMVLLCSVNAEDRKVHIVYMGSLPQGNYSAFPHHINILQKVLSNSFPAENSLIRSYNRSFNGFAALLTEQEAQKLAGMKHVVSVFPSQQYELHTTRSWNFMGFNETIIRGNTSIPSDVIVGVIDTGIWPDSESFRDEGFSPPPERWKGACNGGTFEGKPFKCNNKLIGARYYTGDSAFDTEGHGTHTASTAAGNIVEGASFYGLAQGMARGGVPSARIAAYKVCTELGCGDDAILAAFDDAIADGVDIITTSIGSISPITFRDDVIAIASFHAMVNGILTIQSAGNSGPSPYSAISLAPWLLTVGASSIDRRLVDKVILGDGTTFIGSSVNSFTLNETNFPLVYGKEVSQNCSHIRAQNCNFGCIDKTKVAGKIVLCRSYDGIDESYGTGAVGAIALKGMEDVSFIDGFPASALSDKDIDLVVSYFNSTSQPKATILKSETITDSSAPLVASFSSRGPNTYAKDILKPDVVAPGIDILAAYSPVAPPSEYLDDVRRVNYSILSGTSMSCPHTAGVAAYVKTVHPEWSPAAIKSAIMTTAWPMNSSANNGSEFAFGHGHINPVKAIDPGLVYDADKEHYIEMLCDLGYRISVIRLITGDNTTTCHNRSKKLISTVNFNYPSMTAHLICTKNFTVTFHRTVTNVGPANSTYNATITSRSSKIGITVVPEILAFESVNENRNFQVTVVGDGPLGELESGLLVFWQNSHIA